jgi:hypothetical protein
MHKLRDAIRTYDKLLRTIRASLCENDRKVFDLGVSTLQQAFPGIDLKPQAARDPLPSNESFRSPAVSPSSSQRYLGEASDIRFFNAMKQTLFESSCRSEPQQVDSLCRIDSYEQDEVQRQATLDEDQVYVPSRATADNYVEIYFSTIHIAYPFVWRPVFMETYEKFWQSESLVKLRGPWLSLLCK